MKAIKITIILNQVSFGPYSEEIARDLLGSRNCFGVYRSFTQDNVTFEEIEISEPKYTNEEYLDLHGSKDNAYLKARISSQEYFKLPEDKRRFYMRFCGHDEVYYTLNPEIK